MSTRFAPTQQQQGALDCFRTGESLRIIAGAGTGKTSTLRLLADSVPRQRVLYMAYNRAIKDDATKAFPSNTRAYTSHGLAFRAVGSRYSHRLKSRRQAAREQATILGLRRTLKVGDRMVRPDQQARWANSMVTRFCNSADDMLTEEHLPPINGIDGADHAELAHQLLPAARKAWDDLTSMDGSLRFTHDVYLKLFALGAPKLPYDVIAYDEAQDATPVTARLVKQQQDYGTQITVVGDSSQAIYGWRGAVDAMDMFDCAHTVPLSKSFRFGPAIAEHANLWLNLIDAPLRLTGHSPIDSRIITGLPDPAAVLCRSNVGAITELVHLQDQNVRTGIVGGGRDLRALAEAAGDLKSGRGTSHPDLAAFTSWGQVQEYGDTEEGRDLRAFVDVIDTYGPDGVMAAIDRCVDESAAQTVVSTAHKAKGREWGTVKIADDFTAPQGDDAPALDEAMLAYVSVTRARMKLDRGPLRWVERYAKSGTKTAPGAKANGPVTGQAPISRPTDQTHTATPGDQAPVAWPTKRYADMDLRPVKLMLLGEDAHHLRKIAAAEGVSPHAWVQARIAEATLDRDAT